MFEKTTSEGATSHVKLAHVFKGAVAAISLLAASPAMSADITKDVGSSERVNLSGQLGTLSERITAAACNLSAGVATTEAAAVLHISTHHFSRINQALLAGNRGFGILGEETRPRTLRAIEDLNAKWEPLQELANGLEAASNDIGAVESLAEQSDPLQREAQILVSEITGQYADPVALLHADALLLEIAGRQRMLSNRMSKNVCLIASDVHDEEAMAELSETITLFEISLGALQNGMESVGVRPPPNDAIAAGLQVVADEWATIRPVLEATLGGAELTDEMRAEVFLAFLGMEGRMNNVVTQYMKNSKQVFG
ncbi:type IV pili methyl-accepting chemotaxis transducer N-terminal domain-containing protein [Loktanella sp. F6476L]|uniref:type IV pili methyl-accepting chemotaxis transducer N-terminal domain-containing protein n=1 Tax=Loktanella sp. F6476L TaxID=2926405 RepID=UPI001FF66E79|nr:type IV pili methyl-accepting chemotaxis transducer N-terminal domain-containing protein [Loktanella sp. F6476L]MCK0121697.1 type IV pili methyl-accepting chemotaxis transducer N-terminal domain-containing protein [Loktanella sp. F6476L]